MPVINHRYKHEYEDFDGNTWYVTMSDTFQTAPTGVFDHEFDETVDHGGCTIEWHGEEDDIYDPIKSSTASITFRCTDSTDLLRLNNIFNTGYVDNWFFQVWKGESDMKWWGYINPADQSRQNADTPSFEVTASDILGVIQGITIFGQRHDHVVQLVGGGGTTTVMYGTAYKFSGGRYYNNLPHVPGIPPTHFLHKEKPTVVQTVLSLLYDLHYDTSTTGTWTIPQDHRLCRFVDSYTKGQLPQNGTYVGSIFNRIRLHINEVLYHDYDDYKAAGLLWPVDHNFEIKAYDLLKNICNLFNARLMQKDGVYYFIQTERFDTGGTIGAHEYFLKDAIGVGRTGLVNLTASDYQVDVSSPQTNPTVANGGMFQAHHGLSEVSIDGTILERTAFSTYTQKSSKKTVALSYNNKMEQRTSSLFDRDLVQILVTIPGTSTDQWQVLPIRRTSASGNSYDIFHLHVAARLEARNGTRTKYQGDIFSNLDASEAAIFMIGYDSDGYLMNRMSWNTEEGIYGGSWTELAYSDSDLGEVLGFTIQDATDWWLHYLYWLFLKMQGY